MNLHHISTRIATVLFFTILGFTSYSQTGPGGQGKNDGTSPLELWLKADAGVKNGSGLDVSDGENVATWEDQSGNGRDATQGNDANRPVFDAVSTDMNGFPTLSFEATESNQLDFSLTAIPDGWSVYVIFRASELEFQQGFFLGDNSSEEKFGVWDRTGNSDLRYFIRPFPAPGFPVGSFDDNVLHPSGTNTTLFYLERLDGTDDYQLAINGTVSSLPSLTATAGDLNIARIGGNASAAQNWDGEISEVIAFSDQLNDAQRIILDNYLAAKYDITIANDLFAFQSSYGYDVAGVGSSNGGVDTTAVSGNTLGLGIGSSNLDDGDFVMFGHNGGAIDSWLTTEQPLADTNFIRLEREWVFDTTGTPGLATISIDTASLPTKIAGFDFYYLWLDNDGDFALGATPYALTLVDSVYQVQDIAIADGQVATIALYRPLINFNSSSISVTEGSNADFQIDIPYSAYRDIIIDYEVSGASTSEDVPVAGSIRIDSAMTSSILSVPTTNDADPESDETIIIDLVGISPNVGVLGADSISTAYINDNDNVENRAIEFQTPCNYGYSRDLIIKADSVEGSTDFENYVLLVSFNDSTFLQQSEGKVENVNGYDIRFTYKDSLNFLEHHIERYDGTEGDFIAWIKIPALSATSNTGITMYYGNSDITEDPSTENVWSEYTAVYHFDDDLDNENGNGTFDATATTTAAYAAGLVGQASSFDGTGTNILEISNTIIPTSGSFSISFWFNPNSAATQGVVFDLLEDRNTIGSGDAPDRYFFYDFNGSQQRYWFEDEDDDDMQLTVAQAPLTDEWNLVTVTGRWGSGSHEIYSNEISETDITLFEGPLSPNTPFRLGGPNINYAHNNTNFNGLIDEFRVINRQITLTEHTTNLRNHSNPGEFYTLGVESVNSCTLSENVASIDITIGVSNSDDDAATTVSYQVTGGDAIEGTDFTISGSNPISIAAGDSLATFTIDIVNDLINENNESFTISLFSPTNANLGSNTSFTYTIEDDDDQPTLALADTTVSINEGSAINTVALTLSAEAGNTITVDYEVSAISATLNQDFVLTNGTLNIPAGSSSQELNFNIIDDDLIESQETFAIKFLNPGNALLDPAYDSVVFTINDNDNFGIDGPGGVGNADGTGTLVMWSIADSVQTTGNDLDVWPNEVGISELDLTPFGTAPTRVDNAKNGHDELSFAPGVNDGIRTDFLSASYFPYNEATTFIITRHDNRDLRSSTYATATSTTGDIGSPRFSTHLPWDGNLYYDIGNCCGSDGRVGPITYELEWEGEYGIFAFRTGEDEGKEVWRNNTSLATSAGTDVFSNHNAYQFYLGHADNDPFAGDILEFVMFTNPLNNAQINIVNNYLAAKYDLSIENDLFAFSTTHSFDVVGIGYEDADNFHTAAKANVITLSNASELGTGDYVFSGHNNELKNAWTTNEIPTDFDSLKRVQREWRFDVAGSPGTISVAIDSAKLPAKPMGYADYIVMVDSDGDFTSDATIYSTSLVNGEYVANDIEVSQGSYLTIGVLIRKIDFSTTFANVLETASSNLTIELNQAYTQDLIIVYEVKSGTATQGDDYSLANSGSVTIFAGSTTATLNPGVIDESLIESDETIVFVLRNEPNGTFLGVDSLFTYTITDDDNTRDIEFRSITDYGFKKRIIVDAAQVNADLTDFPLYFTITNDSLRSIGNGGNIEDVSGIDIGFTLADGADWLQHDLESYDPVTGTFVVWVKIPSLSSSVNTLLDFYYGNDKISFDYSSSNVWDSYQGVYHFNDNVEDASINGLNGTNNQTTDVAGLLGQGRDFDGSSDFIDLSSDVIPTSGEFTISFWYNPDNVDADRELLFDMGSNSGGKYFFADAGSSGQRWYYESANDADVQVSYGTAPTAGNWTLLMLTGGWDDNEHIIFEGGESRSTSTTAVNGAFSPRNNFRIGACFSEYTQVGGLLDCIEFDGQMDEFRVFEGRRSLAYHQAEFVNQMTPGDFYFVDTQDTVEVNRLIENIGTVEVSVSIQPVDNTNPTTAIYTATGGTAINGQDYTLTSGIVTVPAGSQTGSFSLSLINDLSDESDETIEITLSNPSSNTKIGANSTTILTVEDDDGLPTISFVDTLSTANEGSSLVKIPVQINVESGNSVFVDYEVKSSTATSGVDFTALTGTLEISAGELNNTISFQPIDDADIETVETVEIRLFNPQNAILSTERDTLHLVSIKDNDDLGFEGPGGVGDVENVLGENLLKLWLIADSVDFSGDDVVRWDNIIKNVSVDYDMVPVSVAPQVVDAAVNGHKEISFNNVSDALISEGTLSAASFPGNEMSFFIVTETDNLTQDAYAYATDDSETGTVDNNSISASIPNSLGDIEFDLAQDNFSTDYLTGWAGSHSIFTHIVSSDTFLVYRNNGSLINRDDTDRSFTGHTAFNFYLGKNGGGNFQGDIAEVIMFSRDVNVAQSNLINNYLAAKYNLSITDDIYNFEVSHGVEVAGIGRYNEDNQHVAARAGIVTISNANDLDDGEYVLFGHDNGDITSWSSGEIPSAGISRTAREWRFDNTGAPGTISIAISSDLLPALPNGNEDYIIMQDADGDFSSGATVINTVLVDGQYKASELTIASGDYVTFGIATRTVAFSPVTLSGSETISSNATISLSLESSSNITLDYEITDGTATGGSADYSLTSTGTVTFIAGQTSINLALGIINDSDLESDETIEITLSNPPTGVSLSDSVFTYTINDDDNGRNVQFNVDNSTGDESVTSISLQVDLNSADPMNDTKVYYSITDGTAEASPSPDYTFTADTLTIPATETTGTIDFTILDDVLSESTETIVVSLSSPKNANLGTNVNHTYSITDNDPSVTIQWQDATTTIDEGGSIAGLVIELSSTSGQDILVDYAVAGVTATGSGVDFSLADGTLTIPAGSQLGTINVALTDDGIEESAETLTVTLSGEVGATLVGDPVHTVTISDNDAEFGYYGPGGVGDAESNMLWLDANAINGKGVSNLTEGASVSTWVDRSGNGYDFTAIGSAPTFDSDALNLKNTVIISGSNQGFQAPSGFSNALSNYSFVSVLSQSSGDYLVETNTAARDEFRLSQGSNGLYSINDTDYLPSPSTGTDLTTWIFNSESGTSAEVFRDGAALLSDNNYMVMAIDNNFALGSRNSDQTQLATDFAGNISEFIMYRNVLNDAQIVIVENYLANKYDLIIPTDLYSYEGTYGSDIVGIGRTNDERHLQSMSDSLMMISGASDLDNDEYVFAGHDNGDDLSWTTSEVPTGGSNVRRLAREWRADVTGSPGTLILKIDTTQLPVPPAGYDQYVIYTDEDGDFRSGSTTYQVEYSSVFGFHVTNEVIINDGTFFTIGVGQPVIQYSLTEDSGDENGTNPSIEVALNFTLGEDATVNYAATGGTAVGSNVDYLLASGTLTIAAGQSSANISLGIINDAEMEDDETIEITLTTPSDNVALGSNTVFTYTIHDDDNPEGRTVEFASAGPGTGDEATPSVTSVDVNINTADDDVATTVDLLVISSGANPADETDDFVLSSSTITFPADNSTTMQSFNITVVDDAIFEGTEQVTIQLTNPVNANLGSVTEYTLDITDNDTQPVADFALASSFVNESAGTASIEVVLDAASVNDVTVNYTVSSTATSGSDFTLDNGSILILAGDMSDDIAPVIVNDLVTEAAESVTITLTTATNATVSGTTVHVLTILDNDQAGSTGPGGVGDATTNLLWLRGDDFVSGTWSDISGNNNDFTGAGPVAGATEINGQNTVEFDGSQSMANATGISDVVSDYDVFFVIDSDVATDQVLFNDVDEILFGLENSNGGFQDDDGTWKGDEIVTGTGSPAIIQYNLESGSGLAAISLNEVEDTPTVPFDYTATSIGGASTLGALSGGGSGFTGEMGEMLVFNSPLNDAQTIIVNNYLSTRYDIGIVNDRFAYDDGSASNDYFNNLIGIGQENSNNIHVSATSEDFLSISNPDDLEDGEYLMMANDGADMTAWTFTGAPANMSTRKVAREWRVDKTGDLGTISFQIDTTSLPTPPSSGLTWALIVTSDGDFTDIDATYPLISISGDLVGIDGLNFTDGDYFSLALVEYQSTGVSLDFNNPLAWTTGVVPTSGTNVKIVDGHNLFLTADVEVGSMTLEGTGSLDLAGFTLDFSGDCIILNGSGSVDVSTPGSTIGYVNPNVTEQCVTGMIYNNIYTDGPSGSTKYMTGDIIIQGDLNLQSNGSTGATFDTRDLGTTDDYDIEIEGDWISEITFESRTGTVTFDGVSAQTIDTDGGETFNNLVINKIGTATRADSTITLGDGLSTNGNLTLTSGFVNLAGFDVTINDGSSFVGGSEDSYLIVDGVGVLRHAITALSTNYTFPIGDSDEYAPFTFTLNSGTLSSSNVTINMRDAKHTNIVEANFITRYWSLNNENITGALDYSVSYIYTDLDVVGSEGQLLARKFSGAGNDLGGTVTAGTNTLVNSGYDSFSDFTAESEAVPLPVSLILFEGDHLKEGVLLKWMTASEINNSHFELFHSLDGIDFESIGLINGNGNTNSITEYSFLHKSAFRGVNYYRLVQYDFDNTEEMLGTILVNSEQAYEMSAMVYPNPASEDNFNVRIISVDNLTPIRIQIIDLRGEVYYDNMLEGGTNYDSKIVPERSMTEGLYFMIVEQGDVVRKSKVIIK